MSSANDRVILGPPVAGSGHLLRRYAVGADGTRAETSPRYVPPRPLPAGVRAADLARAEAARHGYASVAVGDAEVPTWPD